MIQNLRESHFTEQKPHKKPSRKFRPKRKKSLAFFLCCFLAVIGLCTGFSVYHLSGALDTPMAARSAAEHSYDSQAAKGETDGDGSWRLLLVNRWNPIPGDYGAELTELDNGQAVDERIYPALQEMFDAARQVNIYPVVASGYRTAEKQQSLMDEKIAEYKAKGLSEEEARTKAESWVAVPGTSEHQLGLGVDINADGIRSTGGQVYDWLAQNSYQFGFIRRYPSDKTEITGVINEPWHYRYVGPEAAAEIYSQGICLEEYLGRTNHLASAR